MAKLAFAEARRQAPVDVDPASVTISVESQDCTEAQIEIIARRLTNLVKEDKGDRCMKDICGDQTDSDAPVAVNFFVEYDATYLGDN